MRAVRGLIYNDCVCQTLAEEWDELVIGQFSDPSVIVFSDYEIL